MSEDNERYLRKWAADIRANSGKSVDADRLDTIADEINGLRQEVDFLRRYGNKDCTNMADVALEEKRRTGKAPFEC